MDFEAARARLPALTSLRFFAALHVFFFHLVAFRIVRGKSLFYDVARIGYVGVGLFFVLSGFILVYTYAGRDFTPGEFWRARFARIYPAYAFSLLVTLPLFLYAVWHTRWTVVPWPVEHLRLGMFLQITLLHAWVPPAALMWNTVSWSLSVEAFFYFLFPYLLRSFARFSGVWLIVLGVLSWFVSLGITAIYNVLNPDRLRLINSDTYDAFWLSVVKFNPLVRLPEFLIGMACGFYFLRARASSKLGIPLVGGGLLAPAFAAIIYGLAQPRSLMVLNLRPMVLLGDASYSFYLLHSFLIGMCFFSWGAEFRQWGRMGVLLCFAITCGLSI